MKAIIKEIVVYFTYLMVLCTVAYGGFDPQSYRISEATKEMFSDSSYAGGDSFESVSRTCNQISLKIYYHHHLYHHDHDQNHH